MLKSTRNKGLNVLLLLLTIVPVLVATYGIVTGHAIFAEQGRGIALLIVTGMVSLLSFSFYATNHMDTEAEKVEEVKKVKNATTITSHAA